ncbi:MAG: hypothetical protein KJ558_10575 [Gammaproteobacteria bacterium]|nr:hypothetical protein [Gammaproteobacteria bacterium]MBU1655251.1 hypothetical protein [Gammaproteobacteria bacterium]MBU1959756.1 hypothetical protein [Gammaproteobacteria bacterium]
MAQDLPGVARQLQASPPFADQPIIAKIIDLIEQWSELTARRLQKGVDEPEEQDINAALHR